MAQGEAPLVQAVRWIDDRLRDDPHVNRLQLVEDFLPLQIEIFHAGEAEDDTDLIAKSWVQQCLVERGVLFNGSMFISASHTDADVELALAAFDYAFAAMAAGEDLATLLQGPPVQPVFRTP